MTEIEVEAKENRMTLDELKGFVSRHDHDVINRHDLSALERDLAPDVVDHAADPGARGGVEGAREWLSMVFTAFPDVSASIEDIIAEDDKVVVRKVWHGTHRAPFMGTPPTGKEVSFEGIVIWRIEDGKLAERWAQIDRLSLTQQLGVVPGR